MEIADLMFIAFGVLLFFIGMAVGSIYHGLTQPAADCSMCYCKAVASVVI